MSAFAVNMGLTFFDKVHIGKTQFSPIVEGCTETSHVFYGISHETSPVLVDDIIKNLVFTTTCGVLSVPIHGIYVYNKYVDNKIIEATKEDTTYCLCGTLKN
jgi:hypothetical protein